MQGLLSFGSFILGAVANYSIALCQVEVECDEGAMLHAQCTQSRTIDLENKQPRKSTLGDRYGCLCEANKMEHVIPVE